MNTGQNTVSLGDMEELCEQNKGEIIRIDALRKHSLRLLKNQMIETRETESTMENLNKIIKEWEPKLATITLFIRWARHGTRHFNNDSI